MKQSVTVERSHVFDDFYPRYTPFVYCVVNCRDMTYVFGSGLDAQFGRIRIDRITHYLELKHVSKYLVQP